MLLRTFKFLFLVLTLGLMSFSFSEKSLAASLTFTPSSTAFKQGCSAKIDLIVDTQGVSTNAVDAVVLYNPNEVQIVDQNSAVPGIQIRNGSVYEIYAGNVVSESEGKILLTAFSVVGQFNGSGLLASIYFTSKPGVTNTTFQFQYAPNESTDSNVADSNGNDVLSSVNSGAYTFQSGPCVADTQAPSVTQVNPANGSTEISLSSNVSLHILDNQSGVNLSTVEIQIHDIVYVHNSPGVTLTGLPLDYSFVIQPAADFPEETEIVIVVRAADIDGNVMSPKVFSFNRPLPPPAPPAEPVCGNNLVEEGEACEPAGTFGCSATCQVEIWQCLSFAPGVLQQAALQAQESGELDADQIGAINDLETLSRVVRERIVRDQDFLAGGVSSSQTVQVVTETTKTVFESVGCTENCVKILFGEQSERWYVPVSLLLALLLLIVLLTYFFAKKLSEKSRGATKYEEQEMKKKNSGKSKRN